MRFNTASDEDRNRANKILNQLGKRLPDRIRSSGSINDVWILRHEVLRVEHRPNTKNLEVEVELVKSIPADVGYPKILENGVFHSRCWVLQERISGKELEEVWLKLDKYKEIEVLKDLQKRLAILNKTRNLPAAVSKRKPLTYLWSSKEVKNCLIQIEERGWITQRQRLGMERIHRQMLKHFNEVPQVLVHGDLHFGNILFNEQSQKISGIIDIDGAGMGPADMDLYMIWDTLTSSKGFGSPEARDYFRKQVTKAIKLPGGMERWQGYPLARGLWWVKSYLEDTGIRRDKKERAFLRTFLTDILEGLHPSLEPLDLGTEEVLGD